MAGPSKPSSIREKFGIDYLIPTRSSSIVGSESVSVAPGSSPATPLIERSLAAYGSRILEMLLNGPEKSRRLYDIVDLTGLNMETVLGIVDRMVWSGLIEIVENDKYGNHRVTITPTGEQMLHQ